MDMLMRMVLSLLMVVAALSARPASALAQDRTPSTQSSGPSALTRVRLREHAHQLHEQAEVLWAVGLLVHFLSAGVAGAGYLHFALEDLFCREACAAPIWAGAWGAISGVGLLAGFVGAGFDVAAALEHREARTGRVALMPLEGGALLMWGAGF